MYLVARLSEDGIRICYSLNVENSKPNEWKKYFDDGDSYLKTATKGRQNQTKFNPIMIYNITTMAIEKFFMAFFLYNHKMPTNHTMQDLADSIKEIIPMESSLYADLVRLDTYLDICSLGAFNAKALTNTELDFGLAVALRTKSFIEKQLPAAVE